MIRCTKCVLPAVYPGIAFDQHGVCNVCHAHVSPGIKGEEDLRRLLATRRGREFDAVVALSGGRDSIYTLYLAVRKLGLRVLGASFNNGFRTEQALKNMHEACRILEVPFVDICAQDDLARKIVKDTLEFYIPRGPAEVNTHVCGACTLGARSGVVATAIRRGIPFILIGTSEHEANSPAFKALQSARRGKLGKILGPGGSVYLRRLYRMLALRLKLTPGRLKLGLRPLNLDKLPVKVIKIFDYLDWNKDEMERTIRAELNWSEPVGSARSWRIDCDLGPINHYCATKAWGITTLEDGYSNMIRNGQMTRQEALASLEKMDWHEYSADLDAVLKDLQIPDDLRHRFRDYRSEYPAQ